ncbi:PhnD/SsuA/transferrin family substrate-binding protein [Marinobacteraceae bacterium S3BR75-40.1]
MRRRCFGTLAWLAALTVLPALALGQSVGLAIEGGPSLAPATRKALIGALAEEHCEARLVTPSEAPELTFRNVSWHEAQPLLVALNRDDELPTPVWVTRRPLGLDRLTQLADRDLAVLRKDDPVGSHAPLQRLRAAGVAWREDQLFRAGSFSAALGLLLHNNVQAAASEASLLKPLAGRNALSVVDAGPALPVGAWFGAADNANEAVSACLKALTLLDRELQPRAFKAFPEWVRRFVPTHQAPSYTPLQE